MVQRLSKPLLYTYGIADMFFLLMVSMEMFYFAAFLTDYAQFSMTVIGVILWITGAVDIVCALAAGLVLQKVTLRFGGKYRSWFLIGPPIFAPLFVLQFSKIGNDWTAASIIVAAFILSHLLYNVVFTASGSMVGRLSQSPDERTILSTSRSQGWSAAGLIFSVTGLPMLMFFSSRTGKIPGFAITVIVYGVMTVLGYLYIFRMTAGKDPYEDVSLDASRDGSKQSLKEIVSLVFANPSLLLLIGAETLRYAGISITTAFAFYFFTYVFKNLAFMTVFLMVTSIAMLVGAFFSMWIGIQIGKRGSYWIFLVLSAVTFASAKFFGKTEWGFTAIFGAASFFGSIAGSMTTALFADTVIYGEWKTGKNISAFTMALLNFPIKLGILIRSAVVTLGLMAIGFVANAVPTPGVVEGISFIMILMPAVASGLAAIVFYYGYKIEDQNVIRMQDEIAERKAGRLAAAEVRS
jgi:Na+/melibiose symporter-like transporter